jgi:uncharacterized lipoprotein NlpE involved in copper resistance
MKKEQVFCLAGILGILLVFSFVLVGCDNGSTEDAKKSPFEGTWVGDGGKLVVNGNVYTAENASGSFKGTFTYTNDEITVRWTHIYVPSIKKWLTFTEYVNTLSEAEKEAMAEMIEGLSKPETMTYTIERDKLTLNSYVFTKQL